MNDGTTQPEPQDTDSRRFMLRKFKNLKKRPRVVRPTVNNSVDFGQGSPLDTDQQGGTPFSVSVPNGGSADVELGDSTVIGAWFINYRGKRTSTKVEAGRLIAYVMGAAGIDIDRQTVAPTNVGWSDCGLTFAVLLSSDLAILRITADSSGSATAVKGTHSNVLL